MNTVANFNGQRPVIEADDAVLLLIDHQSGLFQTVKDMEMTVLRANATTLAKVATLAKDPRHHERIRTTGSEWPADSRDSQVRSACEVRRTQWTNQCLGQP